MPQRLPGGLNRQRLRIEAGQRIWLRASQLLILQVLLVLVRVVGLLVLWGQAWELVWV